MLIKSIDWPPLAVAGGRGFIAALFLLATSRALRFHFSRVQLLGALGYAACTVTFCVATKLTTAANAILLQYSAPIWIALFGAWFLGERATRADWFTIAAVLGGMMLFFADSLEFAHALGNSLAVISGLCFAGMTIALRKQKDSSPVESIILGNLLAFIIGLPWIIGAPALATSGWIALTLLGTVQLGFSYWLYARCSPLGSSRRRCRRCRTRQAARPTPPRQPRWSPAPKWGSRASSRSPDRTDRRASSGPASRRTSRASTRRSRSSWSRRQQRRNGRPGTAWAALTPPRSSSRGGTAWARCFPGGNTSPPGRLSTTRSAKGQEGVEAR